ncbi:MAG: hypothetical protein J7K63_02850 [Candidatus Marinimicrobia bacterium]|nr:hypothetical protein [Candidatus Neomarinimicrobiota bacterium]
MKEDDYIYINTFYDFAFFRKLIVLLKQNDIDFKIVDKSGPTNFRVPSSTFSEIELWVFHKDLEKMLAILDSINDPA